MIEAPPDVAPPGTGSGTPAPKRRWSWKQFGGKFLFISIAVHVLFGLGAAVYVVQHYQAARKLTFKGGPPSPNPSTRAIEHKVQMAKKQSSMSAPSIAKRITTTGYRRSRCPTCRRCRSLHQRRRRWRGWAGPMSASIPEVSRRVAARAQAAPPSRSSAFESHEAVGHSRASSTT